MTNVKFKFELSENVITVFQDDGIVEMLAFDYSGNVYFVKTKSDAKWFKESELRKL